ncbi:hypothetical protein [Streptacidiphilus sp. EB103A]|uniref:hypothetical protein n=1 Tax=Streptacidiphilus sp. EB103A TaxID=3156275 RepID=UPI003518B4FA
MTNERLAAFTVLLDAERADGSSCLDTIPSPAPPPWASPEPGLDANWAACQNCLIRGTRQAIS